MKFEYNIEEEYIQDLFNKSVNAQLNKFINNEINGWRFKEQVAKQIRERLSVILDEVINEELTNVGQIKEMVRKQMQRIIENKLKKQLKALEGDDE